MVTRVNLEKLKINYFGSFVLLRCFFVFCSVCGNPEIFFFVFVANSAPITSPDKFKYSIWFGNYVADGLAQGTI
jgi:hypothetical protein